MWYIHHDSTIYVVVVGVLLVVSIYNRVQYDNGEKVCWPMGSVSTLTPFTNSSESIDVQVSPEVVPKVTCRELQRLMQHNRVYRAYEGLCLSKRD